MNFHGDTLMTERLILRVLDESFGERILEFFLRNEPFLREWEAIRDEDFFTVEYQKRQLRNELYKISNGDMYKVWIFKKEDKSFNRPIGSVAYNNIVRGAFYSCFLGYRMDEAEINKGYMTEALKKTNEFVFKELKLHRIEANIMPKNLRSAKVVQKLGFGEEGRARKYLKINGKWEDHIHWVLFNEELE